MLAPYICIVISVNIYEGGNTMNFEVIPFLSLNGQGAKAIAFTNSI